MKIFELKNYSELTIDQQREVMEGSIDSLQRIIAKTRRDIAWHDNTDRKGDNLALLQQTKRREYLKDIENTLVVKQREYRELLSNSHDDQ